MQLRWLSGPITGRIGQEISESSDASGFSLTKTNPVINVGRKTQKIPSESLESIFTSWMLGCLEGKRTEPRTGSGVLIRTRRTLKMFEPESPRCSPDPSCSDSERRSHQPSVYPPVMLLLPPDPSRCLTLVTCKPLHRLVSAAQCVGLLSSRNGELGGTGSKSISSSYSSSLPFQIKQWRCLITRSVSQQVLLDVKLSQK